MPKFRYIVVNKGNKQLSGAVDAPDSNAAREELQALGFSIVSLEQSEEKAEEEQGILFEFAGIDAHNKNVAGTIRGDSRYEAFKRLMTEYELDIKYIVQGNMKEEDKEKEKKAGILELMKMYQEEVKKMTNLFHEKKIKNIDRTFEKNKALVMRQVNYVLKKVNAALDAFGQNLNPQDKQTLVNFVNKILRLKNSTNLEYIKTECKNLLQFIQTAEINVTKKDQIEAKLDLYAETQDMISSIQKGKDFSAAEDLEDKLNRWRNDNILNKEKLTFDAKIKDFFVLQVLKIVHADPEIKAMNMELKRTNNQLKQFYTLYVKAPNASYKEGLSESLKKLKDKKKELSKKIHDYKIKLNRHLREKGALNNLEKILDILNGLTGWLVFFYLIFYFISDIITSKQIPLFGKNIPTVFYLFQTGSLKYILPIVFLLHIAVSMKLNLFRKNIISDFFIFPLLFIGSLLIVFNF